MLNDREVRYRQKTSEDQSVPITNFGTAIAHMQGILARSLEVFPHILAELDELAQEGAIPAQGESGDSVSP
jgi:hypothetical protein